MIEGSDKKAYAVNSYGINHSKYSGENSSNHFQNIGKQYVDDDEDEDDLEVNEAVDNDDEGEEDDDENGVSGVQRISKYGYELVNHNDEDDVDDFGDTQKHLKKRKLQTLLSNYEFAPQAPAPSSTFPKPSYGGRNPLTDWTERESFILLNAWGERFLKQGRKSLRSEEWQEVAEKVSHESEMERTDAQCRNRLDTLKKKYKKEKIKPTTKWVYFEQMDELLSSTPHQTGLSCGVDAGEFIFMNPKVYLDCSNGMDEMRDSPENENTESAEEEEDEIEGVGDYSFNLLADSIYKFSEIYQKIENSKREQMVELDRMRKEFQRELELQKKQIFERAEIEIQKIRGGEYDDDDDDETSG